MDPTKTPERPLREAATGLSELLERCLNEGPQMVTVASVEVAVLVPVAQWRRLQIAAAPSLKDQLLSDQPRCTIPLLPRGRTRLRKAMKFG